MNVFIDYIKQTIQQPSFSFQPCLVALSTDGKDSLEPNSSQSFFVAKEFSKQASYFFRVESSPEYVTEVEVKRKEKKGSSTIALNYSVGLKRIAKIVVFPIVFSWFVVETLFEFIVDSDQEEIQGTTEKVILASKENSYQPLK